LAQCSAHLIKTLSKSASSCWHSGKLAKVPNSLLCASAWKPERGSSAQPSGGVICFICDHAIVSRSCPRHVDRLPPAEEQVVDPWPTVLVRAPRSRRRTRTPVADPPVAARTASAGCRSSTACGRSRCRRRPGSRPASARKAKQGHRTARCGTTGMIGGMGREIGRSGYPSQVSSMRRGTLRLPRNCWWARRHFPSPPMPRRLVPDPGFFTGEPGSVLTASSGFEN
jgi:hypothetical protein